MYNFGTRPPRAFNSFGLAGLLGEEAKVYYESVFSTRHVGRISDLLAAKLAEAGADELRLRATLLFTVFEAYGAQNPDGAVGAEPLMIECGIDDEMIAVGVAFTAAETMDYEAMVERLRGGKATGKFEVLIAQLCRQAHRVLLRVLPEDRRVELVGLMALPGKFDPRLPKGEMPLELVILGSHNMTAAPKPDVYVELGDLNYEELLKNDAPGAQITAPATGEILARSSVSRSSDDVTRVKGSAQGADESTRVKGYRDEQDDESVNVKGSRAGKDEVSRIAGTAQKDGSGMVRIAGDASPDEVLDEMVTRVGGTDGEIAAKQVKFYRDQLHELQRRVAESDRTRAERAAEGKSKLKGIFSRLWNAPESEQDSAEERHGRVVIPEESKDTHSVESATVAGTPEATADQLVREISSGGFDKTIARAQQEAAEIKEEMNSIRAKRWMDGLVGDLLVEKGRLGELARKLNSTVRAKEVEFRKKEQSFDEEIRRRDDSVKQKTAALARSKEQLAQATMALERFKAAGASTSEEGHARAKLVQSQKLLGAVKQENTQLLMKIEELKGALGSAQLNKTNRGASMAEMSALQTRSDRLARQVEEFKKANQQLLDRLNDQKKDRSSSAGNVEEMKKRLEAAMKMITVTKKDSERLNHKVEELHRENTRLKADAVKSSRKPGSGSSAA